MLDNVQTIQVEVMLAGWSESHTAGVKLTFWLPDDGDLEPFRALTCKKGKVAGQRFIAVLALLGDDEMTESAPKRHASSDAHLMVTSERFLEYVRATVPSRLPWDKERAKRWAKAQVGIESLAELDADHGKLKRFRELVQEPFSEWNNGSDRRDDPGSVRLDGDAPSGD